MRALEQDLGFLLSRASGLVVRATNAALVVDRLRVRQYSVLSLVCDHPGGVSQRDLAQLLGLDPSQVVALVDELDAAGLVTRIASPTDRRTKLVTATPAGIRRRRVAAKHAEGGMHDRIRVLTAREQEILRELLVRVIASTDQ